MKNKQSRKKKSICTKNILNKLNLVGVAGLTGSAGWICMRYNEPEFQTSTIEKSLVFIAAGASSTLGAGLHWVNLWRGEDIIFSDCRNDATMHTVIALLVDIGVVTILDYVKTPKVIPSMAFVGAHLVEFNKVIECFEHSIRHKNDINIANFTLMTLVYLATLGTITFSMIIPVEGKEKIGMAAAAMNFLASFMTLDEMADAPIASRVMKGINSVGNAIGSLFYQKKLPEMITAASGPDQTGTPAFASAKKTN